MAAQLPACFNVLQRVVPSVRAETARRLVRVGLQQERIAEHLGVSQAMVSKYLRRAPEPDAAVPPKLLAELVESSVQLAMREERRGGIPPWCSVCDSLSDRGMFCATEPLASLEECLRQDRARPEDDSKRLLATLTAAAERIRRLRFDRLVPEVRSNLAMCLADARTTRDVAAFPGRLIEVRGEVKEAAPPEFGASTHLAQILLKVRRTQPSTDAILNLRYDEDVRTALKAARLKARILARARGELAASVPKNPKLDAVIDAGAFGIEPALYLLGENALDAVSKAERLLTLLPTEKRK